MYKGGVLTVSDRADRGEYEDISGKEIIKFLKELLDIESIYYKIVPDDEEVIIRELKEAVDKIGVDLLITSGGTGLNKRDLTPAATKKVIEKEVPGIPEIIRNLTFKITPYSILSCAVAGIRNNTLIINLPGSANVPSECIPLLAPAIKHALDDISGKKAEVYKEHQKPKIQKLRKNMESIILSPTLDLDATVKAMSKNKKVINFTAGEPDFDSPKEVKEKASLALNDPIYTKYSSCSGLQSLREAVIEFYNTQLCNSKYNEEEVIITSGAKQAIYLALYVLCSLGDEVMIPLPYWISYPQQVLLVGGKPKFIKTNPNFEPDIEDLLKNISKNTKVLILNTPNNPTAKVYRRDLLKDIASICMEHDIYIIFDEIYSQLIYNGFSHYNIVNLNSELKAELKAEFKAELKDRVIIVNGVSKSHAMTGWRIGYALGNKEIISAMTKVQSHINSHPVGFSQAGAELAIRKLSHFTESMRQELDKRRLYVIEELKKIDGIEVIPPEGTFYVFVGIKNLLSKAKNKEVDTSLNFAKFLLEKEGVAVVPSEAFGIDNYLRLSFATNFPDIKEGIAKIRDFCEQLVLN